MPVKKSSSPRRSPRPGYVRIIGGAWRGRRLPVTEAEGLRPTPDRVRETLFNWLAPMIAGTRCLDLFAGTGALGLEALSRGAAEVRFVEWQTVAAKEIEAALERLACPAGTLMVADVFKFLEGTPQAFDLVFVDPPFTGSDRGKLCTLLARGWVKSGTLIYVESDRRSAPPELPQGWSWHKEKTAGQVRFALARVESDLPGLPADPDQ